MWLWRRLTLRSPEQRETWSRDRENPPGILLWNCFFFIHFSLSPWLPPSKRLERSVPTPAMCGSRNPSATGIRPLKSLEPARKVLPMWTDFGHRDLSQETSEAASRHILRLCFTSALNLGELCYGSDSFSISNSIIYWMFREVIWLGLTAPHLSPFGHSEDFSGCHLQGLGRCYKKFIKPAICMD